MLSADRKENRICEERIRQARWTFNLSIASVTTSTAVMLVGVGFLLAGRVSIGAYTAAVGGLASSHCLQISKEANDRLDKMIQRSDRDTTETQ